VLGQRITAGGTSAVGSDKRGSLNSVDEDEKNRFVRCCVSCVIADPKRLDTRSLCALRSADQLYPMSCSAGPSAAAAAGRLRPDWSANIGEHVVDLHVTRCSRDLAVGQSEIVVIGKLVTRSMSCQLCVECVSVVLEPPSARPL